LAGGSAKSERTPHKYTARELEIFGSVQKSHFRARAATTIGRYFFIAVIFWALAWGAVHSLEALRGTITVADIKAGFSFSKSETGGSDAVQIARTVFEGLSLVANLVIWALYRNAKKRQDNTVLQLGPFREMYERLIDPQRTTSGLQRDGRTPPEEGS
jgi:hypothetical protein